MINNPDTVLITVLSLFTLSLVVQVFYYLYYYLAVFLHKKSPDPDVKEPVSVIICARNEAENLRNFLPSVLEQDYSDFEVIVVDDCSEDDTYNVLGEYLNRYPHLKVSAINKDPKFTHNKKFAQFIGIKAASNEILLFTDADCRPESNSWLRRMAAHFNSKKTFVLGYGGYLRKKGLLNRYIRYDTAVIAMQYLGMAIRGNPYMGVGRNMAYRRSLFFHNRGYGKHNHIISGDDDLFVNQHATGANTSVELKRESHTRSAPRTRIREWITQKKRHLSTATYYRKKDKLLLMSEPLSRMIFYFSFIVLMSCNFFWLLILSAFTFRLLIQLTVFTTVYKKLNERDLIIFSLFFDIFSPVINSLLFFSSMLDRPGSKQWR
jgi:poly-beta-1,6-N-acetyl-D-glucosamine synthase